MIGSMVSCSKETIQDRNLVEIENYINSQSGGSFSRDSTGFYFRIDNQKSACFPTSEVDNVIVNYRGYFTNNETFDEGQNVQLQLNQTILGWQEALPKLSVGSSGTFIFPSDFGYAANPPANIPSGSVLVFDIGLIAAGNIETLSSNALDSFVVDNAFTNLRQTSFGHYYDIEKQVTAEFPVDSNDVRYDLLITRGDTLNNVSEVQDFTPLANLPQSLQEILLNLSKSSVVNIHIPCGTYDDIFSGIETVPPLRREDPFYTVDLQLLDIR